MDWKSTCKKIFRFIGDVISWTCLCLLILIGCCIVYYFVAAKIYESKGEEYEPYFSLYTIISPSMEPNINVYDVILDTRVDDVNTIAVGDVITFISTGSLSKGMVITHRVVEIVQTDTGIAFRTKGDNNQSEDAALVAPENVLGKTLLKIPKLGYVQLLLANKGRWIFLILIPACGIIIYDLVKIFETSKIKTKVENVLEKTEIVDEEEKKKKEKERKEKLKKKFNNQGIYDEDDIDDDRI